MAIEDDPPGEAVRVMDQAAAVPGLTIGFAARVTFQGAPGDPALAARLAVFARRQAPVWLSLPVPAAQEDVEAWRVALHGLLEQHGSALTILELAIDRQPPRLARFVAQVAATEVRATTETVRIALGGPAMDDRGRREEIYWRDGAVTATCSPFPREVSLLLWAAPNRSPCPHPADGAGCGRRRFGRRCGRRAARSRYRGGHARVARA
jgi:hypothetical protein